MPFVKSKRPEVLLRKRGLLNKLINLPKIEVEAKIPSPDESSSDSDGD
jgi:hypothetical protein